MTRFASKRQGDFPGHDTSRSQLVEPVEPRKWFPQHNQSQWFKEHYDQAANTILDFSAGNNVVLTGRRVADLGCGDGIIALGVADKARPASLKGFDIRPVDLHTLQKMAREEGICDDLPSCLEFLTSEETAIPAADDSFDFIYSWSVFEHVRHPGQLLREVHRILAPDGTLMIQIFPFYYSEHGSHLWEWFPSPNAFAQLTRTDKELFDKVRADPGPNPEWAEASLWSYRTLNRITVDDLQRALYYGGFRVSRLELITQTVILPEEVARYPLSSLGIAGVLLLAVPLG